MVEDVGEADVCGVGEAQDNHAEGVADEQDVDAGFVQQARHRVVVAGEGGDGASAFVSSDGGDFFLWSHCGGWLFGEMEKPPGSGALIGG